MRPCSGAAYCVALCLSVCLSVCPSVPLSSVTSRHLANYNDTHVLFGTRWGPHIVRPSRPHKFLLYLYFPTPNRFPRWPLQPPYSLRPRWVKRLGDLDLWPFDFESGVRVSVTWAISVPILVLLDLSVLDLGPMYATERETSDKSIA